jgi:uncharacterized protein YdbL (DUF1318 family)
MKQFFLTTLAFSALAFPAFALDLHEARNSGVLGEKNDGYVSVLKNSPDAAKLAAEVNAKRSAEYARISKENGQSVAVVAKLAAEQIITGLEAGSSYQDASGKWKTK